MNIAAEREAMRTCDTVPAPPLKHCGCGRVHDFFEWAQLPYVGRMGDDVEAVALRNCQCDSTLAVEVAA